MAHMLETRDGKVCFAYAGEKPWHGLGTEVADNLSPMEMMKAAGLDWSVSKTPLYARIGGEEIVTDRAALVRDDDNTLLGVVGEERWNPMQNIEVFEFFHDFVRGGAKMHTAGSLKHGKIIFALAKLDATFDLFNGRDVNEAHLLLSCSHQYGLSNTTMLTGVRVVCWNTMSAALGGESSARVNITHAKKFDAEQVKTRLGVAENIHRRYAEAAKFLAARTAKEEDVLEFFKNVFPTSSETKDMSRPAQDCVEVLLTQPGAEFAAGTWWNAFNAVTFVTDHVQGRSADNRMSSAWFGPNRQRKQDALDLALQMAA